MAADPITVPMPHNFTPRAYQVPFFTAMDDGMRRAVLVDHRRCGKDKSALNFTAKEMFTRVGSYYYFFPTYNQGRKIIWDGKDKAGFAFLNHFPESVVKAKNSTEMKLTTINDSIFQVVGSDNIDTVVGTNPVGCVFSEYALQDPRGWDFMRPILRENGGWAIFPFTPRGKNHGWDLYQMAKGNPDWYTETLTVDDTYGRGGTVGPEEVDIERRAGMSENLIQQEYYVSFEAAVENAVFGTQLWLARSEKRIATVPWISGLPVNTYWDIGWNDATSIWFEQTLRGEVRLIDFYENRQASLDHYIKFLREKPYIYGTHNMPHDAGYKDFKTGKSVQEIGWELGIDFDIVPKLSEEDQINAARMIFNRCWFDETKCAKGIDALSSYHFEYDSEKRILAATPLHDWCLTGETNILTRYGTHRIMNLPNTGEVLTSCGWKTYRNPRITRRNAPLVEVVFKDGYTVKCTPDHPFLTDNGWIYAEHLLPDSRILSTLTRSRNISMAAYTACGLAKNIFLKAAADFTGMFGNPLSGIYQKVATFIIETLTPRTIRSLILSACHQRNILETAQPLEPIRSSNALLMARLRPTHFLAKELEKNVQNGIVPKKESYGTRGIWRELKSGRNGNGLKRIVCFAARVFSALTASLDIVKGIVEPPAKLLTIASVKQLAEKSDVWCITVPQIEEFSLANGAIVHNSSHAAKAYELLAVAHVDEMEYKKPDRYAVKRRQHRSFMAA